MRIHANDGISEEARDLLLEQGFNITTDHVPQDKLADFIKTRQVGALLVRSGTKVRKELIDACPGLKQIGRGGLRMDKIEGQ